MIFEVTIAEKLETQEAHVRHRKRKDLETEEQFKIPSICSAFFLLSLSPS